MLKEVINIKKGKRILIVLLLIFLGGCTKPISEDLTITESNEIIYLEIGEDTNLSSTIDDFDVYWEVDDSSLLTLSGTAATAIDDGLVYLVARNSKTNEVLKQVAVIISPEEPEVVIEGSQTIDIGEISSFTASISPLDNDQEIVWSVVDQTIASIDQSGNVTGLKAGITKIRATAATNEELYSEVNILVQKNIVESSINNEIIVDNETIDMTTLDTIFGPVIEKGLSSLIGVSSYVNTTSNTETLYASGSGVIYKRNIILKTGEEVAYDANISTSDIKNYKYYLITNRHIIENGSIYRVYYGSETEITAHLIQYDKQIDLAVLDFETKLYFPTATFGDSDLILQGEFCIALGNPYGYDFYKTATIGIISHPTRYVSDDTDGDDVSDWDAKYIQHDAAINEGNSGGALINLKGEVIGINTTKISSVSVDNMGFAIPSNLVLEIVELLEQGIQPVRPKLGVTVLSVRDILSSAELQAEYSVPSGITYGMYIAEVSNGGLGYKAGIKAGDILIEFAGVKIYNSYELRAEIGKIIIGSGEIVEMKVYRNGQTVSLTVVS